MKITINLTSPLKFNFMEMDIKAIQILVGPNGVGKSFILALQWYINMLLNTVVIAHKHKQAINLMEAAQFLHDGTFNSPIDGMVIAVMNKGSVKFSFVKGKVNSCTVTDYEELEPTRVQYLSAMMRTFTAMNMYLNVRSSISKVLPEDDIKRLLESFKLYDILYLESMIAKMPLHVTEEIKKRFEGFDIKDNITVFDVDLEKNEFYCIKDGKRESMTYFGNGHQSLFNIILSAY